MTVESRDNGGPRTDVRGWLIVGEHVHGRRDNPFDNPFYGYRRTDIVLPDGRPATYHGVLVGDMVHALPIEDDLTVHLVVQHRPNARRHDELEIPVVLELPGGAADPRLGLHGSADLELCQEVGMRARRLQQVGTLFPAVGLSDERDHVFLATGLYPATDPDHDEATEQDLRVVTRTFGAVYDEITRGVQPVCARTLSALAIIAQRL